MTELESYENVSHTSSLFLQKVRVYLPRQFMIHDNSFVHKMWHERVEKPWKSLFKLRITNVFFNLHLNGTVFENETMTY